jgi:hypothetical protein
VAPPGAAALVLRAIQDAAIATFERAGARVSIDARGENLIRSESGCWVVHVQGVPNLVHELVHFLGSGRLDDDYGFPYSELPLDLGRRDHRRFLWEELACCTLSLSCSDDPASWFAEQVEILPVFFGDDHDLPRFRARVGAALTLHRTEFTRVFDALSEALARELNRPREPVSTFWAAWDAE